MLRRAITDLIVAGASGSRALSSSAISAPWSWTRTLSTSSSSSSRASRAARGSLPRRASNGSTTTSRGSAAAGAALRPRRAAAGSATSTVKIVSAHASTDPRKRVEVSRHINDGAGIVGTIASDAGDVEKATRRRRTTRSTERRCCSLQRGERRERQRQHTRHDQAQLRTDVVVHARGLVVGT